MTTHVRKFMRKPFYIDAIQVTASNLDQVTRWCKGQLYENADGTYYIKVRVYKPLNERQTKAYIGDWVLKAGKGFKVYSDRAFNNTFTEVETSPIEIVTVENKKPVEVKEVENASSEEV